MDGQDGLTLSVSVAKLCHTTYTSTAVYGDQKIFSDLAPL